MTIFSFSIFDRHCSCIYNRDFQHDTTNKSNQSNSSQLLFGILYSLKTISLKLIDLEDSLPNTLKSFTLGQYRVHYFESLTGLKFILVSDLAIDNLQSVLWELYSKYYLKNVVQNSLSPVEFTQVDEGGRICNERFISETDEFIRGLPVTT